MQISLWLEQENKSQSDLARIIKRDRARAHRIIMQGCKPDDDEMLLIYKATGGKVTANDFYPGISKLNGKHK